jgi:hypothetical protein
MSYPKLAHFWTSRASSLLDHLADFGQVLFPCVFILKKIDVHKFNNHVNNSNVHLSKAPVLRYQFSCLDLYLLNIFLDFNRISPSNSLAIVTYFPLRVFYNEFETLSLVKHHRFLAFDHLGAHRVVEVGYLFESDTLFVEFLGILGNLYNILVNLEAHLCEHTGIFNKSD